MSIRIHVTPDDLRATRFAYSPLIELTTSYHVLTTPAYHAYYQRWVDEALRALHGIDLPFMAALMPPQCGYLPDFLTPTPTLVQLSLEHDLQQMMDLSEDVIHASIRRLIEHAGETELRLYFLSHTRAAMCCLLEELRLYWQRTLEHHWSRLTAILDGDLLYHGRRLAIEGTEPMLSSMHPHLTYRDGLIEIAKHRDTAHDEDLHLRGSGLQLVPSIFAGAGIHWQVVPEWHPMLIYCPRGLGLWSQEVAERNHSLELTLGEGRARVLQTLTTPSNTGEIARYLHISAGAASQHLSRLQQAGLVEPHRSGRHVYYQLTDRGAQLLTLFDQAG